MPARIPRLSLRTRWERLAPSRAPGSGRLTRVNVGGVPVEGPPGEIALVLRAFGAAAVPGRRARASRPRRSKRARGSR